MRFCWSEVSIGMRHVFSAEIDPRKREFIQAMSPDVEHLFGDVACIPNKYGHCYICDCSHELDPDALNIDVFCAGTSCKDISDFPSNLICM